MNRFRLAVALRAAPTSGPPEQFGEGGVVRPAGCDPHLSTPCDVRGFHRRPRVLHVLESVSRYERFLRCRCGRNGIAATVRFHVQRTRFDWGDLPAALERWAPDDTSVTEGWPVEDSREVPCPACLGAAAPWEWETRLVDWEVLRARSDFRIVCLECEAEFGNPFVWDLALPAGVQR